MKFEKFIQLGLATLAVVTPVALYAANQIATDYVKNHPIHINTDELNHNAHLVNSANYTIGNIAEKRTSFTISQSDDNSNNKRDYFRLK